MKKVDLVFNGKFHYYEIATILLRSNLLNSIYVNDKFFLNHKFGELKKKIKFDSLCFFLIIFAKVFNFNFNKTIHQNFPFNYKFNNNIVYCASLCLFKIIHNNKNFPKIIVDHGSPNLEYVKKIIIREMKTYSLDFESNHNLIVENWAINQENYEFNYCSKIIVASNFAKRTFLNKNYYKNVYVNNIITNLDENISIKNFDNKINLIYVGDFSLWKGLHRMLFSLSDQTEFDININLVGGKLKDHILYQRINTKLNNNKKLKIIEHGKLKKKELAKLYKKMNLMVFPSLSDGYGIVVNEAISNGIPVICSIYSGANDLIKKYNLGYSYNPYIEGNLLKKIRLIRNKNNYDYINKNLIKFSSKIKDLKNRYSNNLVNFIK